MNTGTDLKKSIQRPELNNLHEAQNVWLSQVIEYICRQTIDIQDRATHYKQAYKTARVRSLTLRHIRKTLSLVKDDIDNTNVADLQDFFYKLLEDTPNRLKCEIHYHIFQGEATNIGTLWENLAYLFSYLLQETLSETKNAALSKHVNVLHDQNIINSGSLESIKAQADAFEKVSNRRIWPDSSFMPIVLRGAILGYVEFPASKAFKLFPEELPNAVSEILKSTELYLSHVSTYLANIQLQESSYKDQLTGVYNRRGFYEKAIELFLEQPECTGGLIAFDLDHFKRVNDRLWHNVWDAALQYTARKIGDILRNIPGSILARFWWEEFIALVPELTPEETKNIAEHIRYSLSTDSFAYQIDNRTPQTLTVTTSIGVTQFSSSVARLTADIFQNKSSWMNTAQRDEGRKEVGDELGKYIRNADQALYHAKKSGRDNTVEYTSELDQYNLQNYFAQKLNIFKKRLQSFLSIAAPVGMKQDASMQSTEIRQIFTRKSTKTILPLRNSTRNKAD